MISEKTRLLFVEDACAQLRQIEDALHALELSPRDAGALQIVVQAAHRISGAAAVFGFGQVAEFLRVMELMSSHPRINNAGIDRGIVALLLDAVQYLGLLLELVGSGEIPEGHVLHAGQELRARMYAEIRLPEMA